MIEMREIPEFTNEYAASKAARSVTTMSNLESLKHSVDEFLEIDNDDLKPCPWCKNSSLMLSIDRDNDFSIMCSTCLCKGPVCNGNGATVGRVTQVVRDLWNERTKP